MYIIILIIWSIKYVSRFVPIENILVMKSEDIVDDAYKLKTW